MPKLRPATPQVKLPIEFVQPLREEPKSGPTERGKRWENLEQKWSEHADTAFLVTQSPTVPSPAPKKGNPRSDSQTGCGGPQAQRAKRSCVGQKPSGRGTRKSPRGPRAREAPHPNLLETSKQNTRRWAREFSALGPRFSLPQRRVRELPWASFEERRWIPLGPTEAP